MQAWTLAPPGVRLANMTRPFSRSALAICLLLAACDAFDGEALRRFLPLSQMSQPILAAQRSYFACAAAVFSVAPEFEPASEGLPSGMRGWHQPPLQESIEGHSNAYGVLGSQDGCWSNDFELQSGYEDAWDAIEDTGNVFAYDPGAGVVLVFAPKSAKIIVLVGD